MDEAQNRINSAVASVEKSQGSAASAEGEAPSKESGHESAKSPGVGGKLNPGGGDK